MVHLSKCGGIIDEIKKETSVDRQKVIMSFEILRKGIFCLYINRLLKFSDSR